MAKGEFPYNSQVFLTVRQLAERLGVSTSSIWRGVRDGAIPDPVKIGGSTRWHREELAKWEESLRSSKSSARSAQG